MLYPDLNDLIALKNQKTRFSSVSRRSVLSAVPGNHHSPFRGQGLEFDSVREYVPGNDDIRSIDWRVTARTGSPHVKLFREERERHTIICVDRNAAMQFGTKNTFKSIQAAHVASLLGWKALAEHDRVSACLFGDVPDEIQFFPPKRTRSSFYMMLKMLCEPYSKRHCVSISTALKHVARNAHTGSLLYLISDFMDVDEHLEEEVGLHRLNKKCDIIFIAINDPADKSIDPVGTIGFCGRDVEKCSIDTDNLAGREAYRALWQENRRQLYALTSKCRIPLIELTTESDIRKELALRIGKK